MPTGSATLAWDAPTDGNGAPLAAVSGYKIYYGTAPGNYTKTVNVGAVTTYAVTGLAPGTYYFNVTDYDASGNESGFANEVTKTIP
ncbi:fibronectin type III domain-containing protein [Geobacter sp.]|uniref:fibronectin type III domain-containing protein n=1 Tax=Geobacter sp. TaxID=46610 RepID=UPI00262B91E7|nr:fibronectin type III domain-containing protein [Geobacter sp.]